MVEYWQKIILDSWNAYKQNFRVLFGAYLIIHIFLTYPQFLVSTVGLNQDLSNLSEFTSPANILLLLAILFLSGGLWLGGVLLSYCALTNKPLVFKNLFEQFYLLPRLAIKYCISTVLGIVIFMVIKNIVISAALFFIIYAILFFFYDYLILFHQLKFADAVRENFYLVSSNIMLIIQYGCLYLLVGMVFILLPIIGPLLAQSFFMVLGVCFFLNVKNIQSVKEINSPE